MLALRRAVAAPRSTMAWRAPLCRAMSSSDKIKCPPMVYISGEEMTRYAMELVVDKWVRPHVGASPCIAPPGCPLRQRCY